VNGENAAPVYKFLKLGKWGIFGDNIQWNFAKFLVDKDGQIVDRYYPTTSPLSLEVKASFAVSCLFDSVRVCLYLLFQNVRFQNNLFENAFRKIVS